jgi:hypothetical protein
MVGPVEPASSSEEVLLKEVVHPSSEPVGVETTVLIQAAEGLELGQAPVSLVGLPFVLLEVFRTDPFSSSSSLLRQSRQRLLLVA